MTKHTVTPDPVDDTAQALWAHIAQLETEYAQARIALNNHLTGHHKP